VVHLIKNLESGDRKFISRWVVCGGKQKPNLSMSNTFVPISHITSADPTSLTTIKDMRIFTWDINSAYLHDKINHNIYINFPDGYGKPGKVGKLNKALYGLPEAT